MPIVVPKAARAILSDWLWLSEIPNTHVLRIGLWKNNIFPDTLTTFGDLVEATFTPYNPVDFARSDNGASILSGNIAKTRMGNAAQVWTCNANPHTVYGWYLYSVDLAQLLLVERYDTPHVLQIGSTHTLFADVSLGKFIAD